MAGLPRFRRYGAYCEGLTGSGVRHRAKQVRTPMPTAPAPIAHGEFMMFPPLMGEAGVLWGAPHFSSLDFCSPSRSVNRLDCACCLASSSLLEVVLMNTSFLSADIVTFPSTSAMAY